LYDSSVKGARSDDEDEVNMKHEMIVDDEKVIIGLRLVIDIQYHQMALVLIGCKLNFTFVGAQ
jgi:hypothetical protein